MYQLRNVLCATDLSPVADEAIVQAATIASRDGARLVVLDVVPAPASLPAEMPLPIVDQTQLTAAARKALDQRLAKIPAAESASREVTFQSASIASDILQRAEAIGADLVVVASHGQSAVRRVLLGSTAGEVVRHARRPVLVARPGVTRGEHQNGNVALAGVPELERGHRINAVAPLILGRHPALPPAQDEQDDVTFVDRGAARFNGALGLCREVLHHLRTPVHLENDVPGDSAVVLQIVRRRGNEDGQVLRGIGH